MTSAAQHHPCVKTLVKLGYHVDAAFAAVIRLAELRFAGQQENVQKEHVGDLIDLIQPPVGEDLIDETDNGEDSRDGSAQDAEDDSSDASLGSASDEEDVENEPGEESASEDVDDVEITGVVPAATSKRQKVCHNPRAGGRAYASRNDDLDLYFGPAPVLPGPSDACRLRAEAAERRLLLQQEPQHGQQQQHSQPHLKQQQRQQQRCLPNSFHPPAQLRPPQHHTQPPAVSQHIPLAPPPERQVRSCCDPFTAAELGMPLTELVNLRIFGNTSFRPRQREIVDVALDKQDCFVLMPTGGGKSLCFQLPAVIAKGMTVVVCPLLSLMQDQVQALCCNPCGGVPASYLSSQQSQVEAECVVRELSKDACNCKLLYVTPEQLVKGARLQQLLLRMHANGRLARIVIDEAHCVSMWGHDFRPDYKGLSFLKSKYPGVPIMALTATATERVQADILSILDIRHALVFKVSFYRPNLKFRVVDKEKGKDDDGRSKPLAWLMQYIEEQGKNASGIVYCLSRDESEQVAKDLNHSSGGAISAAHYHAGVTSKQRMEVQNEWRSGRVQVVVATIAFGMGIDKPDVRFVVHYVLSKSLEGYFQEAGRAGRDGKPSECVLMYSPRDPSRIINMLRISKTSKATKEAGLLQLEHMVEYCTEDSQCRHAHLLKYFGQAMPEGRCKKQCDICDPPEPAALEPTVDCKATRRGSSGATGTSGGSRVSSVTATGNRGGGGKRSASARGGSNGSDKLSRAGAGGAGGSSSGGSVPAPSLPGFVKASLLPQQPLEPPSKSRGAIAAGNKAKAPASAFTSSAPAAKKPSSKAGACKSTAAGAVPPMSDMWGGRDNWAAYPNEDAQRDARISRQQAGPPLDVAKTLPSFFAPRSGSNSAVRPSLPTAGRANSNATVAAPSGVQPPRLSYASGPPASAGAAAAAAAAARSAAAPPPPPQTSNMFARAASLPPPPAYAAAQSATLPSARAQQMQLAAQAQLRQAHVESKSVAAAVAAFKALKPASRDEIDLDLDDY